jgi:hypothetical protein
LPPDTQLARFVPRRWEELVALLQGHGFDLADNTHPRFPNEWRDDPPLGLVRVKGVWLPEADSNPDANEDERVTFSLTERWSVETTPFSLAEREGLWLASYAYNGHIAGDSRDDGDRNHRHDFDPTKAQSIAYHRHPLGEANEVRVPEGPISADAALEDFLAVLAEEISAGRFDMQ